jgi:hypothetical protein
MFRVLGALPSREAFKDSARFVRCNAILAVGALCFAVALPCISAENSAAGRLFSLTNSATGYVELKHAGRWFDVATIPKDVDYGDTVRTPREVWASIRIYPVGRIKSEQVVNLGPDSEVTIPNQDNTWELIKGWFHFLKRSSEQASLIRTKSVLGAATQTDFMVHVDESGATVVYVAAGEMRLTNSAIPNDTIVLKNGEALYADGGTNRLNGLQRLDLRVRRMVQTFLYYPAVLHLNDVGANLSADTNLTSSIQAYSSGNTPLALALYPTNRAPANNAERLYLASLVLVVGNYVRAQSLITNLAADEANYLKQKQLAMGLQKVMAAAEGFEYHGTDPPTNSPSEWLAESYYQQSRAGQFYNPTAWERLTYSNARDALERALIAAKHATPEGSTFGFGWVRRAELEFSFGRTTKAKEALAQAKGQQEGNAQALALQGFLAWARNDYKDALDWFEQAAALDGRLGNAWLGLGLTELGKENMFAYLGNGRIWDYWQARPDSEGLRYLETAAAAEPDRSLLRSYLGKTYYDSSGWWGQDRHLVTNAFEQLDLAKRLDTNDPTPYLYSALLKQQENRINEAVDELKQSVELNDNRAVYRSQLLLDQDRAVRGANLAQLYQDDGMPEVARREATRAVESDYRNASAHLFLANSYDALRDPNRIELRYETPWFNELLMANLLSPVGGGRLSQFVSQQEYSKLLEVDGLGASFLNEWRTDSELRSTASAFGTYGKTSFGFDIYHRQNKGDRLNSDDKRLEIYGQFKHEVTVNDIFYFLTKFQRQESGDTSKTYDNQPLLSNFRFEEKQSPGLLLAGWNHRWENGGNTLFLGSRLSAEQSLFDPEANQLLMQRASAGLRPGFIKTDGILDRFADSALQNATNPPAVYADGNTLIYSPELLKAIAPFLGNGKVISSNSLPFEFNTERQFEIYSFELQHIQLIDPHMAIIGSRLEIGEFDTDVSLNLIPQGFNGGFSKPAAEQHSAVDFKSASLYAYDFWNLASWLTLIGGVSWSQVDHPVNFRNPPVSNEQQRDQQLSGKTGFIFSPTRWFTMRGVYAEALGGVTFDESVRLEPAQLAGFNQAYRTVLSESIAGSVETPALTIWGLSLEGALPVNTWWGVGFQSVEQDVDRTVGAFTGYTSGVFPITPAYFPDGTDQRLDYRENSVEATINQMLGKEFAVGALYRRTMSQLHNVFPEIPAATADIIDKAILHEVSVFANWNSPNGLFSRVEANWFSQRLHDDPNKFSAPRPGDDFWQFNAWVGYRFHRNRAEISVGMLNLTDADYHLSPLNPYGNIPRDFTGAFRCRFTF